MSNLLRGIVTISLGLCLTSAVQAQYPGFPGGTYGGYPGMGFGGMPGGYGGYGTQMNYMQNFYNRQNQPLSPYLNLLRGGNPGVNYFYGVRPGLPSGGMANTIGYQSQTGIMAGGFLPQAAIPYDPNTAEFEIGGKPVQMRSAAHPTFFGNKFAGQGSYQSVYFPNINRLGGYPGTNMGMGMQGMGQRPALSGLGSATPPPRTR